MTIRNLDAVFRPRAVALIGATRRAASIGRVLLENLRGGGFGGRILPVNPKYTEVLGLPAYPNVASLPETPDLAVIATPAATVPDLVRDLARRGTRAAVIISAEFQGAAGRELCQAALDAARPQLLRIIGPNTLGIIVPAMGLNASFAQLMPQRGNLAFLAQSGAIATSVLDWAFARGIGFSHVVSLGDMADVDFGDMLDYLANDSDTRAILLYIETITHARKFMSAARAAARTKPVVVVKGGRHAASARAVASHTGRLAGPDAEYAAAFRRAGMLRVAALDELFDAVETLALASRPPSGRRLAIVSNGGGLAVLAADALLDRGGELARLTTETMTRLDEVLPAAWSHSNPVDIVGDATAERYARTLEIVLEDPGCDGVLVLHCPTAMSSGAETARAVAHGARRSSARDAAHELARRANGARRARGASAARRAHVRHARAGGPRVHADGRLSPQSRAAARDAAFTARVLHDRRGGRPRRVRSGRTGGSRVAHGSGGARRARRLRYSRRAADRGRDADARPPPRRSVSRRPVALKIVAEGIVHKSEVGGVALNLTEPRAVEEAAAAMLVRVRRERPDAVVRGFTRRADGRYEGGPRAHRRCVGERRLRPRHAFRRRRHRRGSDRGHGSRAAAAEPAARARADRAHARLRARCAATATSRPSTSMPSRSCSCAYRSC